MWLMDACLNHSDSGVDLFDYSKQNHTRITLRCELKGGAKGDWG